MTDVGAPHALSRFEKLVEFFENAPCESRPVGFALYLDFVPARMDLDTQGSLDQSERLLAIPVEGDGRRIVVESQALVGRRLFSSQ
jgi:hypothetical protein